MGFRRSDLQEAFFVPGTWPFRVWGYGTTDPLAEVLDPSYFRSAGGLMHPGDLIYVAIRPPCASAAGPVSLRPAFVSRIGTRPAGGVAGEPPQLNLARGEMRMALVMVRAGENGAPSVRLVQDFGSPDDPDVFPVAAAPPPAEPAPTTPPKRSRGRPPGSRTRRKA